MTQLDFIKFLGLLHLVLILSGCVSLNVASLSTLELSDSATVLSEAEGGINFQGVPLKSGQIIVSDNNAAMNLIVTFTDTEYHPFSHAGIISIEQGKPYVYQAAVQLKLLFRESATDLTTGSVMRISLAEFVNATTVAAIYNPSSAELGKSMVAFARHAYGKKLPYDAVFDPVDRSKVYCSEFIVSAMEFGHGQAVPLRLRNRHSSIDTLYEWLNIDTNRHYFVSDLVSNKNRVALLSTKLTARQIELHFALREELYRRFTADQKIGNILSWSTFGPVFRPQVASFIQRGLDQDFRKPFEGEATRNWVRALANQMFGAIEGNDRL